MHVETEFHPIRWFDYCSSQLRKVQAELKLWFKRVVWRVWMKFMDIIMFLISMRVILESVKVRYLLLLLL